jgi:hypothetical protein
MKYKNNATGEIINATYRTGEPMFMYKDEKGKQYYASPTYSFKQFTEVKPEGHWVFHSYGTIWKCMVGNDGPICNENDHRLCSCADGKHEVEEPLPLLVPDVVLKSMTGTASFDLHRTTTLNEWNESQTTIANQRTELARLNEQVSSYRNEIGELETDVANLKSELMRVNIHVSRLIEHRTSREGQIANQLIELAQLNEQVGKLKRGEAHRVGQVRNLEERNLEKSSKIIELTPRVDVAKSHALIDEKGVLEKERNRILQQILYFVFYTNNDRRNSESITLDDIRGIVNGTRGIVNGGKK